MLGWASGRLASEGLLAGAAVACIRVYEEMTQSGTQAKTIEGSVYGRKA